MILDLFRNEVEFKNIEEYDDLKDIVRRLPGITESRPVLHVMVWWV